jgi:hypothetical protein
MAVVVCAEDDAVKNASDEERHLQAMLTGLRRVALRPALRRPDPGH